MLLLAFVAAAPLIAAAANGLRCPEDFRAFYCGGSAVAAGRDPYRTQPLFGCELAALAVTGVPPGYRTVVPAPLPPYALALFAVFARLPFSAASLTWAAIGILAIAATAVMLARSTGVPLVLTSAALVPSEVCVSLSLGQVVPLALCALCAAAWAIREKRKHVAAAAALACATIEPHVALPALVAAACFTRSMRRPLAVACALLAAVSLAVVGPATCLEYVSRVLPLHARSEIVNYRFQYSLTSLLWAGGVRKETAAALGAASYLFMTVAGVALAGSLSRRFSDERFLVLFPPALGLIGGPFLHSQQMVAALPAAFLLVHYVRDDLRRVVAVAAVCACLAVPWETIATLPAVAARLPADPPAKAAGASLPQARPEELAELPWTRQVEAFTELHPPNIPLETAVKLPAWCALVAVLGAGLQMASRKVAPPRSAPSSFAELPRAAENAT
ncbi:MAG: glycosyltransferase 87 family protein [Candidatus Baltobacteraceae bacterium]